MADRRIDLRDVPKIRPWQDRLRGDAEAFSGALGRGVGAVVDEAREDPVMFGASLLPFGATAVETYRDGAPSPETAALDGAFAALPFAGPIARATGRAARKAAAPATAAAMALMGDADAAEAGPLQHLKKFFVKPPKFQHDPMSREEAEYALNNFTKTLQNPPAQVRRALEKYGDEFDPKTIHRSGDLYESGNYFAFDPENASFYGTPRAWSHEFGPKTVMMDEKKLDDLLQWNEESKNRSHLGYGDPALAIENLVEQLRKRSMMSDFVIDAGTGRDVQGAPVEMFKTYGDIRPKFAHGGLARFAEGGSVYDQWYTGEGNMAGAGPITSDPVASQTVSNNTTPSFSSNPTGLSPSTLGTIAGTLASGLTGVPGLGLVGGALGTLSQANNVDQSLSVAGAPNLSFGQVLSGMLNNATFGLAGTGLEDSSIQNTNAMVDAARAAGEGGYSSDAGYGGPSEGFGGGYGGDVPSGGGDGVSGREAKGGYIKDGAARRRGGLAAMREHFNGR